MNISDHIELSFSNLWKRKLRTSLTTAGVMVGIGALVSMISFGLGMQRNITDTFYYLDMVLSAVGMIAIVVAALGIINTMVMSILERYSEIGIMKAVGASDRDIQKIFFFESCSIGFLGGVFGLGLGWSVSRIINGIVNYFLAKQGVPYLDYFNLTLWLCLGALGFSIVVSLVAGIYPAARAARIDPVAALRHD